VVDFATAAGKIENDLAIESYFRRRGTKLNANRLMTSTIGYGSAGLPTITVNAATAANRRTMISA